MTNDPFGNLQEWGFVLESLNEIDSSGRLSECQHGLARILRFKGNWRLREEVLERIGGITEPSDELANQVFCIITDENLYYDARILGCRVFVQWMERNPTGLNPFFITEMRTVVERLVRSPQPPFFEASVRELQSAIQSSGVLKN